MHANVLNTESGYAWRREAAKGRFTVQVTA